MWRHSCGVSLILGLSYGFVFFLGVLTNGYLVFVLIQAPEVRTTTNIFIGNLAVADLLVTVFCVPFTLAANVLSDWLFGDIICKLVAYIQAVAVNASINSLVAISINKCLTIYRTFGSINGPKTMFFSLVCIWLFPTLIMVPWLNVFTVKPAHFDAKERMCADFWSNRLISDIYFILVNLGFSYLFPLIIISVCYVIIFKKIYSRNIPGELCPTRKRQLCYKSKIRVIKMIFAVVVTFALCWLPLYVLFFFTKFFNYPKTKEETYIFEFIFPLAQWLAASNSSINSTIYIYFNKKIRSKFKCFLRNMFHCSDNDNSVVKFSQRECMSVVTIT